VKRIVGKLMVMLTSFILATAMPMALPSTAYAVSPLVDDIVITNGSDGVGVSVLVLTGSSTTVHISLYAGAYDPALTTGSMSDLKTGTGSVAYGSVTGDSSGEYAIYFGPPATTLSPSTQYTAYAVAVNSDGQEWFAYQFTTLPTAPICEIVQTGTQYATLDAAIAAVDNNQTIRMLKSIPLAGNLLIANTKTFTLNANGFTIDFNNAQLDIINGSSVDFIGCAGFTNLRQVNVRGNNSRAGFDHDLVLQGIFSRLFVFDNAEVTVNGDLISPDSRGIVAYAAALVTINGNVVSGSDSIDARDAGTRVIVSGNVTSNGGNNRGVVAYDGSFVSIGGDVTSVVETAVEARDGSTVVVAGNVTGYSGVLCFSGSTVTVAGSVFAGGDAGIGVMCDGSRGNGDNLLTQVIVGGDIASAGDASMAAAALALSNGQITIDGRITAKVHGGMISENGDPILVNHLVVGKNPTTLKAGYDQYSDTPNETLPTITAVWVKTVSVPTSTPTPVPTPQTPKTGDAAPLALAFALVFLFVGSLAAFRPGKSRRHAGSSLRV